MFLLYSRIQFRLLRGQPVLGSEFLSASVCWGGFTSGHSQDQWCFCSSVGHPHIQRVYLVKGWWSEKKRQLMISYDGKKVSAQNTPLPENCTPHFVTLWGCLFKCPSSKMSSSTIPSQRAPHHSLTPLSCFIISSWDLLSLDMIPVIYLNACYLSFLLAVSAL